MPIVCEDEKNEVERTYFIKCLNLETAEQVKNLNCQ